MTKKSEKESKGDVQGYPGGKRLNLDKVLETGKTLGSELSLFIKPMLDRKSRTRSPW